MTKDIAQIFIPEDTDKRQINEIRRELNKRGIKSCVRKDTEPGYYNPRIVYKSKTYHMETIHSIPSVK